MVDNIINKLSRMAAIAACIILVAMVLLILYEIILRSIFASSTYVLDEFVGYGVAAMTFLSFALALKDGTFIRVSLVTANLTPLPRRLLEIVSCLAGTLLFSFVSFYVLKLVIKNFSRGVVSNSVAEVPLWIPQSIILLGLGLLVLQFAVLTVKYSLGTAVVDQHEEL